MTPFFSRIISLVEEAEKEQAPIEKFTDKVASWLIPVVFIFVGAVYFFTRDVKLVIALLIFTSPAELGLATPLVTIAAIARAAREGILIKGGLFLEELAKITTIVFDKTGTLTVGSPTVNNVEVIDNGFNENQLIQFAAAVDRRSSHPLAKAILSYADKLNLSYPEPENFEVINGRGVTAKVKGKSILLGNKAFMNENKIALLTTQSNQPDTAVYLAVNNNLAGILYVSDAIRDGARDMITGLRKSGIKDIVMLTGDNPETAKYVADQIGIKDFRANLLPEDKINIIKELQKNGSKVTMVGDGINDAPALVQANIGIAMGAVGTEAAMEAADIVLMQDKLEKIARARAISKRAFRTIKENIIVGVGVVHVIGITLVLLRILGPVEAATIHLLPDTLVFSEFNKTFKDKNLKPALFNSPHRWGFTSNSNFCQRNSGRFGQFNNRMPHCRPNDDVGKCNSGNHCWNFRLWFQYCALCNLGTKYWSNPKSNLVCYCANLGSGLVVFICSRTLPMGSPHFDCTFDFSCYCYKSIFSYTSAYPCSDGTYSLSSTH